MGLTAMPFLEDHQVFDQVVVPGAAILDMAYEFPSFLWGNDSHMLSPEEPVCVRMRGEHTGRPLKVKAICLPYVLVKYPNGRHRTLDMRRCRFARLGDRYARKAWKEFGKKRKKKGS